MKVTMTSNGWVTIDVSGAFVETARLSWMRERRIKWANRIVQTMFPERALTLVSLRRKRGRFGAAGFEAMYRPAPTT